MSQIIVGIGDYAVSNTPGDTIKTMALGSCVGIIALSPKYKAVGLLHVSLPDHTINEELYIKRPATFADTGIPLLLESMSKFGCKIPRDIVIKLAGGAEIVSQKYNFDIGKRNILAVKKILWQNRLGAIKEDLGGNISRNVTIEVDTGRVILSNPTLGKWEL